MHGLGNPVLYFHVYYLESEFKSDSEPESVVNQHPCDLYDMSGC